MLGQNRGDIAPKVRCIVKIFDIGTVDTEDVIYTGYREVLTM
jgi:hypothetical protein